MRYQGEVLRALLAISLAAVGFPGLGAPVAEPFVAVPLNGHVGYVVPEAYALNHKADFVGSFAEFTRVEGFWTPTATNIVVVDRMLRELIHRGASDPAAVFPAMARDPNLAPEESEKQKAELAQVYANYDRYARQFVGIIVEGRRLIICNFSDVKGLDPAKTYAFMQKVFVEKGMHFLQARYDCDEKTFLRVSLIGSWWEGDR